MIIGPRLVLGWDLNLKFPKSLFSAPHKPGDPTSNWVNALKRRSDIAAIIMKEHRERHSSKCFKHSANDNNFNIAEDDCGEAYEAKPSSRISDLQYGGVLSWHVGFSLIMQVIHSNSPPLSDSFLIISLLLVALKSELRKQFGTL